MNPNLIFVLLDGSRYDRVNISDEFIELKKQGFFMNNITAAYPYTFPEMNTIFTGLFGKENGVDSYYKMFRLKESIDYLPEILQLNGYFTACDLISEKVISKRGFDIYQSHDEYKDDLTHRHPQLIKTCFEKAGNKPVFIFLQFSRIHTVTVSEVLKKYEWDNKEFFKQKEKNLENYDKAFLETGKYAATISNFLTELGKQNESIIIFFSDHGTGVGERFGERNYGVFTFEETIRTFYLFIGSKIKKNETCDKLFSVIRIFPTLLDICNINTNKLEGKSIAPYLYNAENSIDEDEYTFTETGGLQGPFPSPESPNVFCIKSKKLKLIYYQTPQKWELYDLTNDPNETINLINSGVKEEELLKKKLLEWINR